MSSNPLLKGSLSTLILQLLQDGGRMYGYEISQKLKALSKGAIEVKEGSLYPALHKLEAEGLLETSTEVVDNRLRKYYKLSEKGLGVRKERVSELEEMIRVFQQVLKLQGI